MSKSPKYELKQQVYLVPEFKVQIPKIKPHTIKRRIIDEISEDCKEVQYYLDNDTYPINECNIFGSQKEVSILLCQTLHITLQNMIQSYNLTDEDIVKVFGTNETRMTHTPVNSKKLKSYDEAKSDIYDEEEMRKQGYYKNEKGEWEWDRDLAVSQEYSEIMQEEVKKCKVDTAKKYYDTSELSKEESSRIKSILREFGREDLAEDCSDFEGIGCIIDIFVNYFREFGIAKPLDNKSINNFINEMLKHSIHDGIHFYVQEFVSAIAKEAIEIIKG